MDYLLLLLAVPIVWPFVAKHYLGGTISWQEVGINVAVVLVVGVLLFYGAKFSQTYDVEIWNGQVTGKQKEWTSCEHSYEVCSGSGDNRSCTTHYEHFNDYDWVVTSNVGNFIIDRIDSQGSYEPPRWSKVQVGQPVAMEKHFENLVKAVPDSVFNKQGMGTDAYNKLPLVPKYPTVYDYHHISRVLPVGVHIRDLKEWNNDLSVMLKTLGPKKEANIIIIPVKTEDAMYRYKVESEWLGGKKNDIVVFLGTTDGKSIAWADVMTFALNKGNERFHVTLRDGLLKIGQLNKQPILEEIHKQVLALYDRPHMSDFDYLRSAIMPPLWMLFVIFLLEIAICIGLTRHFHKNDVRIFGR